MMRIAIVGSLAIGLLLTALPPARAAVQADGPSSPSPSPTTGTAIVGNTWSGEIDDASAGRGTMRITFSPDGGKFRSSFADGCCDRVIHVGSIQDFTQKVDDEATFTLHLADAAGCDYSATAHIEDGHLKGKYSGCAGAMGRNSGTFDLLPSSASQDQAVGVAGNAESVPCTVTVTVKTMSGDPVKGARLVLTAPRYVPQDVRTDASGTYEFFARPGAYNLSVNAKGYDGPVPTDFTLLSGVANAGGCNEVLHATLAKSATPSPQMVAANRAAAAYSSALTMAYTNGVRSYCKTAAPMACSYFQMHAGQCLSTAIGSDAIYQGVLALKKSGLSSAQVVEQEAETHGGADSDTVLIAAAAAKIIDDHEHYDNVAFATSIIRVCLAGIAK